MMLPDPARPQPRPPGWDSLVLVVLLLAGLQITGLAEAGVLPTLVQDVLRHPILGHILPPAGYAAMGTVGPRPGDPVGLLLVALSLAFLLAYLLADLAARGRWRTRLKWLCLGLILLTALFLPAAKLILLRAQSGPASYTHDGGVIQTEAAIQFVLEGKNPYREDYTETPMAEWGFSEYRTALYHYPYLPWTFLFSAPFFLLGRLVGGYDQRWVYLLLMALALLLAPRLAGPGRSRFALVALLGLNPIMLLDLIFGQNDSFVLAWLLFSLVAWHAWNAGRRRGTPRPWVLALSTVCFGLACASKPTAWFFAPFYAMLLVADELLAAPPTWRSLGRAIPVLLRRIWPALLVFVLLLLPYLLWDPNALYDDVWRWSTGQGETGYQIWGWGGSNLVLALGLVTDRFAQWPFWVLEVLVAVPLLVWFTMRQQRSPTLYHACWHYALFLFAFLYVSRFLNENYLGFLLAFFAIGGLNYIGARELNPLLPPAQASDQA